MLVTLSKSNLVDGVFLQDFNVDLMLPANFKFHLFGLEQSSQYIDRSDCGESGSNIQHPRLATHLSEPEVSNEVDVLFPLFET